MSSNFLVNSWKPVNIQQLFNVEYGNKFDKCNMVESTTRDIAFVTRTGSNNGVGTYVEAIEDVEPYPAGCLTVALGGSLGATFLQSKPFYTAQNVAVLIPRTDLPIKWTSKLKLFFATLIKKESQLRFIPFGRELNTHIKKDFYISIPHTSNNLIDWQEISRIANLPISENLQTKNNSQNLNLDFSTWRYYTIRSLFPGNNNLQRGKVHCKDDLPDGDEFYYIGAKKKNNGIEASCGYDESLISEGNCVVFICNGQGSVGYALYMDKPFMASGDLAIGYNSHINKYTGLFLVTILDKERFKYSFGRKYGKYLSDTQILLPAKDSDNPDWDYMESFIKSLPYGDLI